MADLLKDAMLAAVRDTLLGPRLVTVMEAATDSAVESRSIGPREVQFRVKPNRVGAPRYFLVTIKEQM